MSGRSPRDRTSTSLAMLYSALLLFWFGWVGSVLTCKLSEIEGDGLSFAFQAYHPYL